MSTLFKITTNQYSPDALSLYEAEAVPYPWSPTLYADSLKNHLVYNIKNNKNIFLGVIIIQRVLDETHILNFWIRPKFQRIGAAQYTLSWLRKKYGMPMFLEVRESNIPAIQLYKKMGWINTGLRKNYYPCPDGTREHAYLMIWNDPRNLIIENIANE
jgi:ribosomal-protein-alanine N-acetyltransferase